jgi:hypothetical protein
MGVSVGKGVAVGVAVGKGVMLGVGVALGAPQVVHNSASANTVQTSHFIRVLP